MCTSVAFVEYPPCGFEILGLRVRYRFLCWQTKQLEHLRGNIKVKETACLAERSAHSRVESERQALLAELTKVQSSIAENREEAVTVQTELDNLSHAANLAGQVLPFQQLSRDELIPDEWPSSCLLSLLS